MKQRVCVCVVGDDGDGGGHRHRRCWSSRREGGKEGEKLCERLCVCVCFPSGEKDGGRRMNERGIILGFYLK